MATNSKNGGNNMTPNMDFSDNSSSQQQKGIFGYLENRSTKNSFAKDYWKEGSGYLDSALKDLKEMQKLYKELEKSQDKMNTSQENQFKSQKRALELQIATLEEIKQTQDVNDRDAIRSITDSNKLRNKGLLDYQKLLDSIAKRQETLKKGDKELASQLREDADYINELYASMNKEIQQQNLNIETTGEKLKNTTGSFSKAMSETLKSASDELTSLLNMFNLDKLANSGLNKFLTDKIAVQNDMMKQFGFETKSQYLDFKNGLDDSLASMNRDMGNIFSGKDLNQYMQNLSSMGITNTKMAQDQMRASIMGSKYLGVSAETQTEMFKWMKRTNDYDMLDEHNKTITGLLKSQLGVSKEQLDALTQIAYENNNTMASIGMTDDAISAVNDASLLVGHSLVGAGLDKDTAGELQKMYQDFITAPIEDLAGYAAMGVSNAYDLQNAMRTTEDTATQTELVKSLFSQLLSSNALTGGDTQINQYLQRKYPSLNVNQMAGLRGLDFGKFTDNLSTDLENVEGALADINAEQNFIEETTEVTWLEKIYNKINEWITGWDSANLTSLANTVFTLWAGSKIFDVFSHISQLGLVKSWLSSSGAMTKLGASGSGLLATGGGILLGAAAVAAIYGVLAKWNEQDSQEAAASGREDMTTKLEGTALAGNEALIGASGIANKSNTTGGFGNDINSTGAALSYGASKLSSLFRGTGDRKTMNRKLTEWMYKSNIFNSEGAAITWAFMLDSLNDLSAFNNATGTSFTRNSLRQLLEQKVATPEGVDKYAQSLISAGWLPYIDNNKGRMKNFELDTHLYTESEGYHKAGLDRVPKENYKALLHKDEMVLSKEDADSLRDSSKIFKNNITNDLIKRDSEANAAKQKGFGIGGYDAVPWPITSRYNTNSSIRSGYHTGTDFGAAAGTPVGAAIGGEVINKSWGGAWGNHVIIKGDNGLYYLYAHFSKKAVSSGRVNTGQTIGYVGSTGNSTGPHLHFEVQKSGSWARGNELDPGPYVTAGLLGDGSAITPDVDLSSSKSSSSSSKSSSGSSIATSGVNTSSDGSTSSTKRSKAVPVSTARFLPSSLSSKGGIGGEGLNTGGADKVVNSVDGGFARLLNYLDGIKNEQEVQKEMLNAFSRAGSGSNI